MNWISDRIVITRYGINCIAIGLISIFMPRSWWKKCVVFMKDWHNELHSISKMVK